MRKGISNKKGASLIELIIAISIFVMSISTIGIVIVEAQTSSRNNAEKVRAEFLALEGIEATLSLRDVDFDELPVGTHGLLIQNNTWTLSGSSDMQEQFTRTITISEIDDNTKQVVSAVSWPVTAARTGSVSKTVHVTDWRQTKNKSDTIVLSSAFSTLNASNTAVIGTRFENTGSTSITLDRVHVAWSGTSTLFHISIDGTDVFNVSTSSGLTSSALVDITDVTIGAGSGEKLIDAITFTGDVSDTDFNLGLITTENNQKYIRIEP